MFKLTNLFSDVNLATKASTNSQKTNSEIIADIVAWAKKTADSKKYNYKKWTDDKKTHECPICNNLTGKYKGWNCIGYAFATWRHGGGLKSKCNCGVITNSHWESILKAKTDSEATKIAQDRIGIKDIKVIRNGGKVIPTDKLKKGDIIAFFDGNTYKHTALYIGNGKMSDDSGGQTPNIKYGTPIRKTCKVAIRYTGGAPAPSKKGYTGPIPTLHLKKTNAQVIADTLKWAKWIASDNRFHYGYTSPDKKINAHHNGCYFCKTQPKSKKGVVDYQFSYCCNPFVGAAWAHGGCVPKAISLCRKGTSWDFGVGKGYDKSSLFTKLGRPKVSALKPGDVLCSDSHAALYIGNGKVVQAGHGDDNVRNSKKWNSSISIGTWNGWKRAYRFNSSVDADILMRHGEVSERVAQWQAFLDWYFDGKVGKADGYFGDNTLKWTKKFQEQAIGKGQGDGICGEKTFAAARKVKK